MGLAEKGGNLSYSRGLRGLGSKQQLFISLWILLMLNPKGLGKRAKDSFWEKLFFQGSSTPELHFQLLYPPSSGIFNWLTTFCPWCSHFLCISFLERTSFVPAVLQPSSPPSGIVTAWARATSSSKDSSPGAGGLPKLRDVAELWLSPRKQHLEGLWRDQAQPATLNRVSPWTQSDPATASESWQRRTVQPAASWIVALILQWRVGCADFSQEIWAH